MPSAGASDSVAIIVVVVVEASESVSTMVDETELGITLEEAGVGVVSEEVVDS